MRNALYDSEPRMKSTGTNRFRRMATILALGLLGILIAAPSAAGQAAIKQYIPKGNPAGGGGRAGGTLASPIPPSAVPEGRKVSAQQEPGTDKGGTLPGTDYPGTPWLWIVIGLLIAGALARIAAEVRERRLARGAP